MAKKPLVTAAVTPSEEPDVVAAPVEITIVSTEDAAPEVPAAPVVPIIEPFRAPVHFVTSFNNGTLAEANAAARADNDAQQAKLAEAHKTALAAVNKAFAGTGTPMSVVEAAAVKALK